MQFFRGKTNKVADKDLIDYLIMKHMRWSYQDLMTAPASLVNKIRDFMKYESMAQKEELDNVKR